MAKVNPAIDHRAFPHNRSSSFLTSTPVAKGTAIYVQIVEFYRGSVMQQEAFGYDSWPIRLVRRERD